MSVVVLYFAAVRELVGTDEERMDLPSDVRTVSDFASFLARRHPQLEGRLGAVRFARNEVFATNDEVLAPNDVLAVIPPVAGG